MIIKRVYNNNVILAVRDDGTEVVLLGRSLGFNAKVGTKVDERLIEQTFTPETDDASVRTATLLSEVPLARVRVAARIVALANERLRLRSTQALLLAVVDHLNFAVLRAERGLRVDFPLRWEVANLYPAELEVGRAAVALANEALEVELDPDEAVAFALHLVNAGFASDDLNHTVQMTATIGELFRLFEEATGWQVDRNSMSATRFVTHLRYLFVRLADGGQIVTTPEPLVEAIIGVHPEAFALANKMRYVIELHQHATVTRDELAYLTLHVARLSEDQRLGEGAE